MEKFNLYISLIAGIALLLNAFSAFLRRKMMPEPLLALLLGVMIGPFVFGLIDLGSLPIEKGVLLEEAARLTLGVSLAAIAFRLPHGYWRKNWKWLFSTIGIGMIIMWAVATGVLWGLLGLPLLTAMLVGAIITPTDPVVSSPIVNGSIAEENIPDKVRYNISSESGVNDGAAYLFVFLPILLLTGTTETAWRDWVVRVLLWEVLAVVVIGILLGYVAGKILQFTVKHKLIEESALLVYVVTFALFALGFLKLIGTDAILGVFIASAVLAQTIPQGLEEQQDKIDDAITKLMLIPIFVLLGAALPIEEWIKLGIWVPAVLLIAILGRRIVAIWSIRPLINKLHTKASIAFLSWFGAIGVSALYYATVAERKTGDPTVFYYVTLAITLSLLVHATSATPFSKWLNRRVSQR